MNFSKCFNAVSSVVEEANKQFGITWRINNNKKMALERSCLAIDSLAEEFDGVSFEVNIDDITMEIKLSLVCGEIIVKEKDHKFYEALNNTIGLWVKEIDDSTLQLDFVFPSIWDRAI